MVLEDGTTWALPVEVSDAIGTVIDVSLPPVSGTPPRYRTRNRVLILLVTRGPLRIEAGFGETMLETGDSIVVGAGVPHRLTGDPHHPTAYLVLVPGTWDGTL